MRADTPSHTARLVARSLLLASKDQRLARLLAPQAAELLAAIPEVAGGRFGDLLKRSWARRVMFQLERLALPGAITHYLVRKLAIETEVRDAIADGAARVVVIGAGFDTLASRLHREFPAVQWIEVDHPATQALKIRSLEQGPNLRFLGHNLASPQPLSRLLQARASAAAPTVVVIEGVTMYLTESQVADLLNDVAGLAGPRGPQGRVILTFMEKDRSIHFRGQHRAAGWWLRLCSEPFLWGISRHDLPAFLHSCGLGHERVSDHSDFRNGILQPQGLQDLPLAEGECLCVCSSLQLATSLPRRDSSEFRERRTDELCANGATQTEPRAKPHCHSVEQEEAHKRVSAPMANCPLGKNPYESADKKCVTLRNEGPRSTREGSFTQWICAWEHYNYAPTNREWLGVPLLVTLGRDDRRSETMFRWPNLMPVGLCPGSDWIAPLARGHDPSVQGSGKLKAAPQRVHE